MIEREHLVSVILPTYYRNDALSGAIESVFQQTHNPVELIVVDDSGEAHAEPVVRKYDEVTYIPLSENKGAQAARNVGLEQARGQYVQFLDDDDELHPEKFEKQISFLNDSVGVVYSGYEVVETGEVIRPKPDASGDVLKRALLQQLNPCSNCTMLIDADVLEDLTPLGNRHAADDVGLKIELALRTKFDYVDTPLIFVEKDREDNLSASWEHLTARKQLLETYAELYEQYPHIRKKVRSDLYRREGLKHLETSTWNFKAILAFGLSAYNAPDDRVFRTVEFFTSIFGQPGLELSDHLRRFSRRYVVR